MPAVDEMPTTSIRWSCTKHLLDLLRRHELCQGVGITAGHPGDKRSQMDEIWPLSIDSEVVVPTSKAGRKARDDRFTVTLVVRVSGRISVDALDATQVRLAELLGAIEDVFADDPSLEDFPGVISAEITSERQTAADTPDGVLGYGEAVITVHTRLA